MPGTYTLAVELDAATTRTIGALGTRRLDAGRYAYTGSAFGPGGFARIDRHRELAAGDRTTRHWHVDSLLTIPEALIVAVTRTPDRDVECAVAERVANAAADLGGGSVAGVGASDCDCDAHLAYAPDDGLLDAIDRAHDAAAGDRA
ncbi:DUF123 domain-containing protein [Halobacteriales archaeon SW_7_68_16]|nr:MAG: DUF123 domain-containing protein [Halobacteriales archaeon SW_7_68_16]